MAGWGYLITVLIGAALVANAARPRTGPLMLVPSWLAALLTLDLAPHHVLLACGVSGVFVWAGALDTAPGQAALALAVLAVAVLILLWLPATKAPEIAADIARTMALEDGPSVPRSRLAIPFQRVGPHVVVTRDVEFFRAAGRPLKLDIYRSGEPSGPAPALIYLHGGAWVAGDKRHQGLPLCNHLAAAGWVCFNANYRLSPAATYPDPVVDCKAAIAWVREHAARYQVDARFVALAGGSSGAHIAAMTALTGGDAALQPGFARADTSVQAVVTSYGLYDLTNRLGLHHPAFFSRLVGPMVIKAFPDSEAERFRAASPQDHAAGGTMPWLVLHGARDRLAPPAEARAFAAALREQGQGAVGYAEFPAALHGFDIWYSHHAVAALELSARFLNTMYRRARHAAEENA